MVTWMRSPGSSEPSAIDTTRHLNHGRTWPRGSNARSATVVAERLSSRTVVYSAAAGRVNCGRPQSEAKREAIFRRARSS
jgi:hypothetical protein